MSKRIGSQVREIKTTSEKTKFSLGILAVMALCTFLLIIATFTKLSLFYYAPHFGGMFGTDPNSSNSMFSLFHYEYIPQIPVVVYIAALLGPIYAVISVFAYLLLGLSFFPIFALGGGYKYIFQYNFGYILAYIPAVIIVTKNIKKKFSYRASMKACILAVLSVHLIGIMYAITLGLLKREPYEFILNWIVAQSFSKMIYDIVFSFFAILLAKISKKILWIVIG